MLALHGEKRLATNAELKKHPYLYRYYIKPYKCQYCGDLLGTLI